MDLDFKKLTSIVIAKTADKAVEVLSEKKKKEEEKPKPKVFSFFPWLWKFICFINNRLGGKQYEGNDQPAYGW